MALAESLGSDEILKSFMTLKEAEEQSGLSYEEWEDLTFEYLFSGGTVEGFTKAMGLSEAAQNAFEDEFSVQNQPRRPTPDTPVRIPDTSPTRYISFQFALNLKFPWEFSGDWHFEAMFFGYKEPRYARVAGTGTAVDTNPSLGSKGVRDMAQVLADWKVRPHSGPVYVANHYRAVADLALWELQEGEGPALTEADKINDWIRTQQEMETLKEEYLKPLRFQLGAAEQKAFDEWMPSLVSYTSSWRTEYNPEYKHLVFPPTSSDPPT